MISELHFYNPLIQQQNQKPQLCFVGSVAMVLRRRGLPIPSFGLDDLAYKLGIFIDKKDKHMFGGELRKRALDSEDPRVGFQISNIDDPKKREKLEQILGVTINLCRSSDIDGRDKVKSTADFLISNIEQGNDVIVNYRHEPFNGRKDGHWVVLAAVEKRTGKDLLYVADPSPFTSDFWKEKLEKFIQGMSPKWDGQERGFLIFSGQTYGKKYDPVKIREFLRNVPRYRPSITKTYTETPQREPSKRSVYDGKHILPN